jgi:hypothetical protein
LHGDSISHPGTVEKLSDFGPAAMERKVALSDLQIFVSFLGRAQPPRLALKRSNPMEAPAWSFCHFGGLVAIHFVRLAIEEQPFPVMAERFIEITPQPTLNDRRNSSIQQDW